MAFDERLLNGMSVFAAVVDGGSFAAAGEALDMSPPGVSRAIARLEARLGIRLFNRTTRSVNLTDEGRRFHAQVLPLLAGLEEAATSAAQGATSELNSGDWTPARLRVFSQQDRLIAIAEAVVPRTYQPVVVFEPLP